LEHGIDSIEESKNFEKIVQRLKAAVDVRIRNMITETFRKLEPKEAKETVAELALMDDPHGAIDECTKYFTKKYRERRNNFNHKIRTAFEHVYGDQLESFRKLISILYKVSFPTEKIILLFNR